MNSEAFPINHEFEAFRKDVHQQFTGVRAELKELTKALRDLIRLEGDIKRVHDIVTRVGNQVDDLEVRVRIVETGGALTRHRISVTERLYWLVGSSLAAILTGVAVYALTR